jgi:DNA primase
VVAVRERTDIVTVISGHLQLKKSGRDSMTGLCPFHPEKTPSFHVSPSKQLYHCFGCHEGGDVIRFLEKVENLSFPEAVERLAQRAGITLRYEGETEGRTREVGRRQAVHRALDEAAGLYQRMLLDGREATEARRYLDERGIGAESIERFGIGYAPGYPDYLLRRLSKTYSPELLVEAGLVAQDSAGAMRDRFRGRVMFPIHDVSGNAVGFGGRLLGGDKAPANAPKYLNSPETTVYHKGSLLYNLGRAKADITATGRAFMVEGYTDVIALDQAGIRSAVATCGTALGEEHLRLLSRFADHLILSFDSDEAGARAAERAFAFHENYPVDIAVLVLPEGQDPADFVLANGGREEAGRAFEGFTRAAVPLVEYMLGRNLKGRDLSDVEERARAVRSGLQIVAGLKEQVRRHEYARVLAGKVGEPEMSVMLQLEQLLAGTGNGGSQAPDRARRTRVPPEEEVEWEVLKLLVQAPDLCASRLTVADAERFAKPTHRRAFELIVEQPHGQHASALVALAHSKSEALGRVFAALAVEPLKSEEGEPTADYAERYLLRLEEFALKRQADVLRKQVERMNPLKTPADYEAMFAQLIALEGARRRLKEQAEAVGSIG